MTTTETIQQTARDVSAALEQMRVDNLIAGNLKVLIQAILHPSAEKLVIIGSTPHEGPGRTLGKTKFELDLKDGRSNLAKAMMEAVLMGLRDQMDAREAKNNRLIQDFYDTINGVDDDD